MAARPNADTPSDRKKLLTVLVPAIGVAALLLVIVFFSGIAGAGRAMSDGSNGSADDADLKEISKGVKYRDVREGEGEACPKGAKVKIHYTGWLTNGTVFDTSKERGEPATFKLEGLIAGWQEGIPGMKRGGIRKLVIAPEKGYGSQMAGGGKIPPNSTLIFEVELLDFSPGPRPRRSPIPTDLTKLSDGTLPNADDSELKPIGKGGLLYRDIKVGDGPEVKAGDRVVVDYIGWRRSDGGLFDSSFKQPQPFTTSLAEVVPGWQQGIPGMKVGGVRKLVIPPELGYGSRGAGEDIPPNATLVFEVELLGIE
jgi:peptidylprolyl isomerase